MVPVLVLGMVFGRVLALLLQGQWRAAMIDFLAWVPSLVLVLQLQLGEGKPVLR
jgi:hypothetical protein